MMTETERLEYAAAKEAAHQLFEEYIAAEARAEACKLKWEAAIKKRDDMWDNSLRRVAQKAANEVITALTTAHRPQAFHSNKS